MRRTTDAISEKNSTESAIAERESGFKRKPENSQRWDDMNCVEQIQERPYNLWLRNVHTALYLRSHLVEWTQNDVEVGALQSPNKQQEFIWCNNC